MEYRTDLVRQLQAHKKYHQYMSKVLEVAGDFHENSEIMSRYQTLLATYEVRCVTGHLAQLGGCLLYTSPSPRD